MTERGEGALKRDASNFQVGPSALEWDGSALHIRFDELSLPWPSTHVLPRRIRGEVRMQPEFVTGEVFDLDGKSDHSWWPIAPAGRIEMRLEGGESWSGDGYLDSNWGVEPLENGFRRWDWARGRRSGKPIVLYDALKADGGTTSIAAEFSGSGARLLQAPPVRQLNSGLWRVERFARCDAGKEPRIVRPLEDSPFYTRALVDTHIAGEPVRLMHESFSGQRFASPLVKAMLPFRMPRRPPG